MPELFSFFLLLLPRMNTVTALLHMFFCPVIPISGERNYLPHQERFEGR